LFLNRRTFVVLLYCCRTPNQSHNTMAIGKNPRLSKGGKRGSKKRPTDVMTRKEWYDVVAPTVFSKRQFCKTLATKSFGNKLASDNLKGRVFEMSLGDLMSEEQPDYAYRKMKLKVDDVQGRNCVTNFYGMDLTRDKYSSLVKKWCTLIEGVIDVKTSDGYVMRVFCIAFTDRKKNQIRKNCHAQTQQVRRIRAKMFEVIHKTISKAPLQECVKKFQLESIGKAIQSGSNHIFPLRDVVIRRVKLLKMPKIDLGKLMDIHGGELPASKEEVGQAA